MFDRLLKFIIVFSVLTVVSIIASRYFDFTFGQNNYWDHRGIFFLFFITLFPRLTLLFSSVVTGGLFWWLGFLFAPRFLVALLATLSYWQQNPILVSLAWVIAIGGESTEKYMIVHRSQLRRYRKPTNQNVIIDVEPISRG